MMLWLVASSAHIMLVVVGVALLASLGFVACMDRLDRWAGE